MTASPANGRCHAALVDLPIDTAALLRAVADPAAGATALFLGTVRNVHDGRSVMGIDYHAYAAMATRHLAAIVAEASQRYGTCGIAAEHRVGHSGTRRDQRRHCRVARAPGTGVCGGAVRDRGDQAARADLEARALRRWYAGVGRSDE